MKLWYEVVSTQWSTPTTHARHVTISLPLRLDRARRDAQDASLKYGNCGIFEMPGGHLIAEYKNGVEVDTHTGAEVPQ